MKGTPEPTTIRSRPFGFRTAAKNVCPQWLAIAATRQSVIPTMSDFSGLRRDAPLPFEIELINGSKVAKVGEAMSYLLKLGQEKPRKAHWDIAIRMFSNAQREPAYLKAATISLQTAFALERLLLHM